MDPNSGLTPQSPKDISELIATLLTAERRTWTQIGFILDRVEQTGHWRELHSPSFSDWLRKFADSVGLKEASLWRYLTAARYYGGLQKIQGIECPDIQNLSDKVSPESLELLAKIGRAVSDEVFQDLALRVIFGKITRVQLRALWKAYRPVFEGRTARGAGVPVPRVDHVDPIQANSLAEAAIYAALYNGGPEWTGHSASNFYYVFTNVFPAVTDAQDRFSFDAVASVLAEESKQLVLHGIQVMAIDEIHVSRHKVDRRVPYCDFLWVAIPNQTGTQTTEIDPAYLGVLVEHDGHLHVVRKPKQTIESGRCTGDTAKALFQMALSH